MNGPRVFFDRQTWTRFTHGIRKFRTSEVGGRGTGLFLLLIGLLLAINGANVVSSYVGRDFMTAIANRKMSAFLWSGAAYFVVLVVTTVIAVNFRYAEEKLGLLWRGWLTRRLVGRYFQHPTYYRLNVPVESGEVIENPDQRIADDVRAFTTTTLSFVLLLTNALLTVIAFSGVMWSISPLLFSVAVLYAVFGSALTVLLGQRLIGLNYDQLDKEADFRSALIHVRENAESVAMNRDESQLRSRTLRYFDALFDNTERIISVNRRLGFFTTGYNNFIALIPALIIAPLFMRGEVEFGVITQAAMAFGQLLGAFSLIVTQFQSISWFAAVIVRLGSLMEAMDQTQTTGVSAIELCEQDNVLIYERLSLQSPRDGRSLLKDLSISIPKGTRLLVTGEDESAKLALFKATAGIWHTGAGRVISPGCDAMLFLPEHPYVPPGSLRQLCARGSTGSVTSEDTIEKTLEALDLEHVWKRAGSVDTEQDWSTILSLSELQLLAVARVCLALPSFVFLDRLGTSLNEKQIEQVLGLLSKLGISYLTIGNSEDKPTDYDAILSIRAGGEWQMRKTTAQKDPGGIEIEQSILEKQ